MERIRKAVSVVAAVTMLASVISGAFAPAWAGKPTDDLKQIEYQYYFRGKYQQAIEALQTYLARVDLAPENTMRAREVLAASYVLGGAPAMGKTVFAQLIADYPSYEGPDPAVFKLEVVNVYAEARSDYAAMNLKNPEASLDIASSGSQPAVPVTPDEGKPIYKKWWFYAGAASLLAVAGALTLGQGGESTPPAATGSVVVGVRVQ